MISGAEILEIGAGPPRSPSLSFSSRGSAQLQQQQQQRKHLNAGAV